MAVSLVTLAVGVQVAIFLALGSFSCYSPESFLEQFNFGGIPKATLLASPLSLILPAMIVYMGLMGLGTLLGGSEAQQRYFLSAIVVEKFSSTAIGLHFGERVGGMGYVIPNIAFGVIFLLVVARSYSLEAQKKK